MLVIGRQSAWHKIVKNEIEAERNILFQTKTNFLEKKISCSKSYNIIGRITEQSCLITSVLKLPFSPSAAVSTL